MRTRSRWNNLGGKRRVEKALWESGRKSRGALKATNASCGWHQDSALNSSSPRTSLSLVQSLTASPLSLAHSAKVFPPSNLMEEHSFVLKCAWQRLIRNCYLDFLQLLVILTPLDRQEWPLVLQPEDSDFSNEEEPGQSVEEGPGFSSRLVSLQKCPLEWKVLLQQGMSPEFSGV